MGRLNIQIWPHSVNGHSMMLIGNEQDNASLICDTDGIYFLRDTSY